MFVINACVGSGGGGGCLPIGCDRCEFLLVLFFKFIFAFDVFSEKKLNVNLLIIPTFTHENSDAAAAQFVIMKLHIQLHTCRLRAFAMAPALWI